MEPGKANGINGKTGKIQIKSEVQLVGVYTSGIVLALIHVPWNKDVSVGGSLGRVMGTLDRLWSSSVTLRLFHSKIFKILTSYPGLVISFILSI